MKSTIGLNFNKFDVEYKPLVTKAVEHMEVVLAHPVFLEVLKDEIEKSGGLKGELSDWKEALPLQIYAQLFPIVLNVNTYYTSANVIGYGLSNTKEIYINTKYISKYSIANLIHLMEVGSNLLHEHSHDCGFKHDYIRTARRPFSLSYIMNRAYERAFKKIYALDALPAPVIIYKTPWYKKIFRKVKGWF